MSEHSADRRRGIFTLLLTPFSEDRALNEDSLRRPVELADTDE